MLFRSALPHETPRLESVPPAIDATCEEIVEPLAVVVERQRKRAALNYRVQSVGLEWQLSVYIRTVREANYSCFARPYKRLRDGRCTEPVARPCSGGPGEIS